MKRGANLTFCAANLYFLCCQSVLSVLPICSAPQILGSLLQVRRSFLQELEVHNNWSVVDMLFREFYTGSDRDLAADERAALEKGRRKLET